MPKEKLYPTSTIVAYDREIFIFHYKSLMLIDLNLKAKNIDKESIYLWVGENQGFQNWERKRKGQKREKSL